MRVAIQEPIFSVVIPALNREATVERTLGSVRRAMDHLALATGHLAELILVDDGSTDATLERAEHIATLDPRVVVVTQRHAGVSEARNAGAARATAQLLTFLDCDDEVEADWLTAYAEAFATDVDLVFAPGRALRPGSPDQIWKVQALGPSFGGITAIFNPGMFALRRTDFLAIGGYSTALRFSENTELGIRLTESIGKRGIISTVAILRPLVDIHIRARGVSNADRPEARMDAARYLINNHGPRLALDPRLLGNLWAVSGVAAGRLGRWREARRDLARAALAYPRSPKNVARLIAAHLPPVRRRLWPAES